MTTFARPRAKIFTRLFTQLNLNGNLKAKHLYILIRFDVTFICNSGTFNAH